jgi:hypothetical protein
MTTEPRQTSPPLEVTPTTTPTSITTLAYNTTSSPMSQPSNHTPPQLLPSTTDPNTDQIHDGFVFNYYFLFLAAVGILVVGLLWWLQRKKKRRKEQMRLSGQQALARDLEGWPGSRRFMHGRYGRNQTAAHTRVEDGLDENGEAPPPYQPKTEARVTSFAARGSQDAASNLSIPLRALSRDETERLHPPEHMGTIRASSIIGIRSVAVPP